MNNFHFLIATSLRQYLEEVAKDFNLTIRRFIETAVVLVIDQIDFLYQEYGVLPRSVYETVNNDGITNMHIVLPHSVYLRLKWLQGNFNNYGMAQIVRRCIFLMLILIQQYGSMEGAIAAIERLNEATSVQQESRDEHGFMRNRAEISQLLGNTYVSYVVILFFMRFMLFYLYPPPQIV